MGKTIEESYGTALRGVMFAINPIKKHIIKTYCTVHKYINIRAMEIIKREGHEEAYRFYLKYVRAFNEGTTWADQDFKSTNHFYHFSEEKGLYGFSNALTECRKYYNMSLRYAYGGDMQKALFYFGAACHLIQDSTVPQHVNNRLLDNHREFEVWIVKKVVQGFPFEVAKESKRYEAIDKYVKANALAANNTYMKYIHIKETEKRYRSIANIIIQEAEKTTAGFMLDYYRELCLNDIIPASECTFLKGCALH